MVSTYNRSIKRMPYEKGKREVCFELNNQGSVHDGLLVLKEEGRKSTVFVALLICFQITITVKFPLNLLLLTKRHVRRLPSNYHTFIYQVIDLMGVS